ncbi:MAG: hypothetical protein GY854_22480 [Deltaproteobacteria bacterium]|nr:hypothetical protein [Deltaproteobacteria bacterium]
MRGIFVAACLALVTANGCQSKKQSSSGAKDEFAELSTGAVHVLRDEDGRVMALRGRFAAPSGEGAEAKAKNFVDMLRDSLGIVDHVEFGQATVSDTQIQTVSFPIEAGGYPIEGGQLTVRLTPDEVFYVSVAAPTKVPDVLEPTLDAAQATTAAKKILPDASLLGEPELVVFEPSLWRGGSENPRLAWRVSMVLESGTGGPALFIDAADGSELGRLEQMNWARDRNIVDIEGLAFHRDFKGQGTYIYNESDLVYGATAFEEATTAWDFAAQGCDFIDANFRSHNTCDPLYVFLNYRDPACHLQGDLFFQQGDLLDETEGYRTFMHELGHALVRKRVNKMAYEYEPGAIHEALADVISILATTPAREWIVDPGHQYERNISAPDTEKCAKHYDAFKKGEFDVDKVHHNSVILSHAIWLATIDGMEVGHETAEGMGYEAMTSVIDEWFAGYLDGCRSLKQAAVSFIDACMVHPSFRDTFGIPTTGVSFRDCGLLVNALAEVGLSEPDGDLDGWPDNADNCNNLYNPFQLDVDKDRKGDVCSGNGGRCMLDTVCYNYWGQYLTTEGAGQQLCGAMSHNYEAGKWCKQSDAMGACDLGQFTTGWATDGGGTYYVQRVTYWDGEHKSYMNQPYDEELEYRKRRCEEDEGIWTETYVSP